MVTSPGSPPKAAIPQCFRNQITITEKCVASNQKDLSTQSISIEKSSPPRVAGDSSRCCRGDRVGTRPLVFKVRHVAHAFFYVPSQATHCLIAANLPDGKLESNAPVNVDAILQAILGREGEHFSTTAAVLASESTPKVSPRFESEGPDSAAR
jgi:hypothetical protein